MIRSSKFVRIWRIPLRTTPHNKEMKELLLGHNTMIEIVAIAAIVMVATFIDLATGIKKAREAGIATTSTGLKRTAEKYIRYYLPYFCLACIDLLASICDVYEHPYFSAIFGAFLCLIEFKSVMEKTHTKEEIREAENTMQVIIKNKEDLAQILAEVMKSMSQTNIENNESK